MSKKLKSIIAVMLILVLSLTACGDKSGDTGTGDKSTSSKKPAAGADANTLTVVAPGDPRTVDPHASGESNSVNALMPIFETLLEYDKDGVLTPMLAESYKKLDDLSWEFKLKKGIKFHNGEEMKASDVLYSFTRATSEKGQQVRYILDIVDSAASEVVDDYTVIIRTHVNFAPFDTYLPYIGCVVVSEKAYESEDAENKPVGTGPFVFQSWTKGDKLTYTRFEDYWREKPNFENLVIKSVPDVNSRLIELETGAADIAMSLTINEANKVKEDQNLELLEAQTTVFMTLNMNNLKEEFDNKKFRQAIDYALDENAIIDAVYRGSAIYTPGPVVPHQKYFYDGEVDPRYDVEKAKQLLKESGVDIENRVFTFSINEDQTRVDLATAISNQLKTNLGLNIEINQMEVASFYDYLDGGEQDFFIVGWGAVGFPDADNNIYGPLHSNQIPLNNHSRYSNPTLDKMLEDSRQLEDGPEREKLIFDIQKLIRDETPYITFSNTTNMVGVSKRVKGFDVMPTSHQYYTKVQLAE